MRKLFEEPSVEVQKFESADVIMASQPSQPTLPRDENEGDLDL